MAYTGTNCRAAIYADVLTLEYFGPASSSEQLAASPRLIPLGAIRGHEVTVFMHLPLFRIHLRGHDDTPPALLNTNVLAVSKDAPIDAFPAALTQAVQHAAPVEDFEPPRPQTTLSRRSNAGNGTPFLDWMQG